MSHMGSFGGQIVPCAEAKQASWLDIRLQLWSDGSPEEMTSEMEAFCADPERFAQFLYLSTEGLALGLIEVALRMDYVNGTESSPVAFLEGIYVAPGSRRRGISRALVAAAETWAETRGCTEFASDAPIENTESYAMHVALGFAETERVVFFRKAVAQ